MQTIEIKDLAACLDDLVHQVETTGVAVSITRAGHPIARLEPYHSPSEVKDATTLTVTQAPEHASTIDRDLPPNPRLHGIFAPGYDPAEPLSEDEWPSDCR
jgi:antitoxin (DNA-binding transcriptional repressor) of toxin-antitoxin stability system